MKYSFLLAASFFLQISLYAEKLIIPNCPIGQDWQLVSEFSDEFDAKKLNSDKWWDFNPDWYGRKPGYFSRENVKVKKGMLQLMAKNQNPRKVTVEHKERGYDLFTTSSIKSKQKIRYGYFEARCKGMDASVCNAFWLYDPLEPIEKYKEGSFSEEIDIFEFFGKPTKKSADSICFATVHRFYTPYVESLVNSKKTKIENPHAHYKVPFRFQDDFHIYALKWTPEELVWYIDGKEIFKRHNDYFHTSLHLMFDCEIMKGWIGLPDPKDLPATFYIDYVRVWQRK